MRPPLLPVVLALMLTLPAVLASPGGPSYGQTVEGATMTVLKGEVAVVSPDGSAVQPAPSGTVVNTGDEIRTLSRSGALITFFVGTEIELGEESVLLVERVSRTGEQIDVSLKQVFGTSLHRVLTLADPGSSYRVEVGGAVALVRGTVFAVGHAPPHRAFYVQEGLVDCDQRELQPGGYWNSGGQGCEGLQSFRGSSLDPWNTIAEGLGLAAAVQHVITDDSTDDSGQARSDESEDSEEDRDEDSDAQHQNTDNPGHSKNEDNPGHSGKH